MRAESSAICTSGEPVSVGLRRYCWTIPPFVSVDNDMPNPLPVAVGPVICVPFCEPRIVLARPIISSKTAELARQKSRLLTAFVERALAAFDQTTSPARSEEHTSELQSQSNLVCRLLLEKKK